MRETLVLTFFVAAAIVMTWPLAAHLSRAIAEPDDPFFTTWVLDWDYYATIHHRALFDANIFSPARETLAFSEHMYGIALFFFPLFALGVAPLTIHNIAMLVAFAGCGYAMYLLCRAVTGSTLAAIPGGIFYAFVGFRFHHLPHLHFVWSIWLPILLLALLHFARQPTVWRAVGFCAAFIMNGLGTLHWFAFGSFAIAVTAVLLGVAIGKSRSIRFWAFLIAAVLVGLVVLSPFLLPYEAVAKEYGMHRYYAEALTFSSASWRDWLEPGYQSKIYGRFSPSQAFGHERTLFPGFVTYLLAALGLFYARRDDLPVQLEVAENSVPWQTLWPLDVLLLVSLFAAALGAMLGIVRVFDGRILFTGAVTPGLCLIVLLIIRCWHRWPFGIPGSLRNMVRVIPVAVWVGLLWFLIGAFGARGLYGWLDSFLFDHLAGFRSIRAPVRWVMISYVGLGMLASVGVMVAFRKVQGLRRIAVFLVITVLLLLELRAAPLRWFLVPLTERPTYEWIRTAPFHGSLVEFPMTQAAAYDYLWHATRHHRPLINGVSSYIPPEYDALVSMYARDPIPDALLTALEQRGCSIIVVHDGLIQNRSAVVRDWLRRGVESGRLTFVRRFDAGPRPDYVFALTRTEPTAATWRAPEVPDPAGFTPLQNAQQFLADDPWTYTAQTIGNIDVGPTGPVRGDLDVVGWATGPTGIDHVKVCVANASVCRRAQLFDRADVTAVLPWHPAVTGFRLHFPAPPRQAEGDTDLQVILVDRLGRSHWMPPFWFRWSRHLITGLRWHRGALDALVQRLGQDPAKVTPAIMAGRASISDYTSPLVTDALVETDLTFVNHAVETLLDEPATPAATDRYLRLVMRDTSRERVIKAIIRSPEFARKYLLAGTIP